MFDYVFAEQGLPWAQCPKCNKRIKFHGGWFPTEAICGNCGNVMNIKNSLSSDCFPNNKYDEEGKLLG